MAIYAFDEADRTESQLSPSRHVQDFRWGDRNFLVLRPANPVRVGRPPGPVRCCVYTETFSGEPLVIVLHPDQFVSRILELVRAAGRVRITQLDREGRCLRELDGGEQIGNLHLSDGTIILVQSVASDDHIRFDICWESLSTAPIAIPLPRDITVSDLLRTFATRQRIPDATLQAFTPLGGRLRLLAPSMSFAERDPTDGFTVLVKSVAKVKRNETTPAELEDKMIDLEQYDPRGDLGHGSFGRVTRYAHRETGEEIAVKAVDVSRSAQALREVAILSQLTHPCILTLAGVVLPRPGDPTLRIATDLIHPGSLDHLISDGHLTTPTEQVKVLVGILMGMRYLHRSGIMHRDLKPANVLVDDHWIAKIADFGTSKVHNVDIANTLGTGTPLYQAPEILQGRDDYGFPADVYSFGCMCFEILTGRRVFLQKSFIAVGIAVIQGLRPDIPHEWSPFFGDLVDRSWAVDSERRPTFDDWFQCLQEESFCVTDHANSHEVIDMVEGILAWERDYE
jgi:hypothetical protein